MGVSVAEAVNTALGVRIVTGNGLGIIGSNLPARNVAKNVAKIAPNPIQNWRLATAKIAFCVLSLSS